MALLLLIFVLTLLFTSLVSFVFYDTFNFFNPDNKSVYVTLILGAIISPLCWIYMAFSSDRHFSYSYDDKTQMYNVEISGTDVKGVNVIKYKN